MRTGTPDWQTDMRILNIGSVNVDHVYEVEHFVRPGETLRGLSYRVFAGGKGFNQSVALARAGAAVLHAGRVGKDAAWLIERLQREGVDTSFLHAGETPTGHAVIQVAPSGENAIVLYGGANQCVTEADVLSALSSCSPGDWLLLQNETSGVAQAIRAAHERGMKIVFNPAPMTPDVRLYPLDMVDIFILNETEAEELTGAKDPGDICAGMRQQFPRAATVLTLGDKGALYSDAGAQYHEPALPVNAVDTTAAGDTFIGYFLAELMRTGSPEKALALGCRAAAVCVTIAGAADSIPARAEVTPEGQTPQRTQ